MATPPGLLPALDALFGGGGGGPSPLPQSADARRAAAAWLEAFQQEDAAWQVRGLVACDSRAGCVRARGQAPSLSPSACARALPHPLSTPLHQASLALLATPAAPPHARAFAAQTVRAKAKPHLGRLSPADAPGLRDALVSAFVAEAQGQGGAATPVLHLLAAALADLAVAWEGWVDPVNDVVGRLARGPAGSWAD